MLPNGASSIRNCRHQVKQIKMQIGVYLAVLSVLDVFVVFVVVFDVFGCERNVAGDMIEMAILIVLYCLKVEQLKCVVIERTARRFTFPLASSVFLSNDGLYFD